MQQRECGQQNAIRVALRPSLGGITRQSRREVKFTHTLQHGQATIKFIALIHCHLPGQSKLSGMEVKLLVWFYDTRKRGHQTKQNKAHISVTADKTAQEDDTTNIGTLLFRVVLLRVLLCVWPMKNSSAVSLFSSAATKAAAIQQR